MKKILVILMALLNVVGLHSQTVYRYWFDDNHEEYVTGAIESEKINLSINTSHLKNYLHQLNFQFSDAKGLWSPPISQPFSIESMPVNHRYWLNEDSVIHTAKGTMSNLSVDISHLPAGLHILNYIAEDARNNLPIAIRNVVFASFEVFNPQNLSTLSVYAFVNADSTRKSLCKVEYNMLHVEMDFSNLDDGLHKLNFIVVDSITRTTSVIKTAYFFKTSALNKGINAYTYWINDDESTVVTKSLDTPEIPYHIIGLWKIPSPDFDTKSFTVSISKDSLTLYAQNQFNFYATDNIGGITPIQTLQYRDDNTCRTVISKDITHLDPCTDRRIGTVPENEIKWFELDAEIGDSLIFRTDFPCMIDLFSPSGNKLWSCYGGDATLNKGIHAKESGKHYLAIHDCISNNKLSLTYNLIDRYYVLEHTPLSSARGDLVHMQFIGNGYEHLQKIELISPYDTIDADNLKIDNYSSASCTFNLKKCSNKRQDFDINLVFKAKEEEILLVKNGFTLLPENKGKIKVDILPSYRVSTPYDVTMRITNTGNVPYWGIPFTFALDETGEGVTMEPKDFAPYVELLKHKGDNGQIHVGYVTNNFLGTGKRGYCFPIVLPYLGAEEVIDLTLGFVATAHKKVNLYAWTGEPWSEDFQRMTTTEHYLKDYLDAKINYLSAKRLCYYGIMNLTTDDAIVDSVENSEPNSRLKAYVKDEELEEVVENLETIGELTEEEFNKGMEIVWGKDTWNRLSKVITKSSNLAEINANLAQCIGMTNAGIINSLRLRGSDPSLYGIDPSDQTFSSLYDYRESLRQATPHPAEIAARCRGEEIPSQCFEDMCTNPNPRPQSREVEILMDGDPNDIYGYLSESGSRFVGIDVVELPYCIEFENSPEIANASANYIKIENKLNPEIFDLDSFNPLTVTFGKYKIAINGEHDFVGTVDMRPSINAIAEVSLKFNSKTGEMVCIIKSLDPLTLEHTKDYMQGVLPVNNNNNEGVGTINYKIALKNNVHDETVVENFAKITFGSHEPIYTPKWKNITDYIRPISLVSKCEVASIGELNIYFDGFDTGSGIWKYNLYCSTDSCETWECIAENILENKLTIDVKEDLCYHFACLCVDYAGNKETKTLTSDISYFNGEITTNISEFPFGTSYYQNSKMKIYNLSGQRIRKVLEPGIYICDGKKVYIRK